MLPLDHLQRYAQNVQHTHASIVMHAVSRNYLYVSSEMSGTKRHKARDPVTTRPFSLATSSSSCESLAPTGMIIRPPSASCSTSSWGKRAAAADTMIAL